MLIQMMANPNLVSWSVLWHREGRE